jgi:phage I-like protein
MYVRKVRNENRVGKITLSATEVAVAKKMGVSVEKYVIKRLEQIAKERRWKWFFKEYK